MNAETRATIKGIMEDCVAKYTPNAERWEPSRIWQAYPFQRLFFTVPEIAAARAERSTVTSMGSDLYPRLAEAIANERFNVVRLEYTVEGELNDDACNTLEQIVTTLREPLRREPVQGRRRRRPRSNSVVELARILDAQGGDARPVAVKADFYIEDFTDGPLFMELKTPRPNLDIAAESKRKMLYFLAMMRREGNDGAQAFLGLTYNPFVTRDDYDHSPTHRIMDMENEVLIGSETWDFIGGPGTYDELLEIIEEINPS